MFVEVRCIWEKWIEVFCSNCLEVSLQRKKITVFWLPAFRRNCLNHTGIYSLPGRSMWVRNTGYCSQNYVASHARRDYLHNHCHENFQISYSLHAFKRNLQKIVARKPESLTWHLVCWGTLGSNLSAFPVLQLVSFLDMKMEKHHLAAYQQMILLKNRNNIRI